VLYLDVIKKLVEKIPGATGCIMVDSNGEEVVVYAKDDEYQMKLLGAHMVPIHKRLEAISNRIESGDYSEILVRTDNYYIITSSIENENYLILRLSPTPAITPSILNLKQAVRDIIEES
jgi:predicted regulator of Ras-like GTPase activity (Roadblock/LC7/MglB family)